MYGGIPAFIHAKQNYIEQSQAEIYHNRFDAVVRAGIPEVFDFLHFTSQKSFDTLQCLSKLKSLQSLYLTTVAVLMLRCTPMACQTTLLSSEGITRMTVLYGIFSIPG